MAVGWHRPTRLIVDTQAIRKNVLHEVARMPKGTELFAVVKANGYGHGVIETAKAAEEGGASGFCVAMLDEAIELREAGFKEEILILNVVDTVYIELLLSYDLSVTVTTTSWLKAAEQECIRLDAATPLKIHIKIDSGMGRIGFTSISETAKAARFLEKTAKLELEGIFTHFATADQKDGTYFDKQRRRFQQHLDVFSKLPKYIHLGNSATALWHPENMGNMIRFGVAMYGLNPSGETLQAPYPLEPAMRLVSKLTQVKKVSKGEGIGYGKTYTTETDEWIGTIPIGYADGWLRHLQGFSVLVDGVFCEIIGRICMDQCMIRLPKEVIVGTEVTLIGKNGKHEVTMQMVADKLTTIHYEVACTFSQRIPREYH